MEKACCMRKDIEPKEKQRRFATNKKEIKSIEQPLSNIKRRNEK